VDDCDVCGELDGRIELPGGFLWDSELVVAFHVPPLLEPTPLLGHLLITPRRHADTWADLTPAKASEIGVAAAALAVPLREMTGAERIYSAVTGHHSAHFHLHVFPRYPWTPKEFVFVDVDRWDGSPKGGAHQVAEFVERFRSVGQP
jgi:diadenosine tetraphosphate (Ap4A) HIT family hydrolase